MGHIKENLTDINKISKFKLPKVKTLYLHSNRYEPSYDVIIVTALYDTEYEALLKLPIKMKRLKLENDNTLYYTGRIEGISLLFATDDKMGIAAISSLTTKLIFKFRPKFIIMSGIAAGIMDTNIDSRNNIGKERIRNAIKKKNIQNEIIYGDILVANITWNYESGKYKYKEKLKKTVFEPQIEQKELDSYFDSRINTLKSDKIIFNEMHNNFRATYNNKKPKNCPKVILGPVASGSAVVADEKKIEQIKRNNRKLKGLDMETYGFYYASKYISEVSKTKAISIKSVSDFANKRKSDYYRKYAAYTSSNFIYQMIIKELFN